MIEQCGDTFQDPNIKTHVAAILRRCLPPRPRPRGYPEVSRAIRMLDELHALYPEEPYRSVWQRIYPVVIAGHDAMNKLEKLTARQELRERVRWRRRQARYRARKRKTT